MLILWIYGQFWDFKLFRYIIVESRINCTNEIHPKCILDRQYDFSWHVYVILILVRNPCYMCLYCSSAVASIIYQSVWNFHICPPITGTFRDLVVEISIGSLDGFKYTLYLLGRWNDQWNNKWSPLNTHIVLESLCPL